MSKPADVRNFYEDRAKKLIKQLRADRGMPYSELAEKLKSYGVSTQEQALINRLNSTHRQFAFAMMVLDALGVEFLEIPKPKELYPDGHKPGQPLTRIEAARELQKLFKK